MKTDQQAVLRRLRNAAAQVAVLQPGSPRHTPAKWRAANRELALAQLAAVEAGFPAHRISAEMDAGRTIL
jgi:hypothetical protein